MSLRIYAWTNAMTYPGVRELGEVWGAILLTSAAVARETAIPGYRARWRVVERTHS